MKVAYYYRGRTGSAGFRLPEDMALLKRLFAHGGLPPKAQLQGKRCWLYLRVNTSNPAADEIGISGQDTYFANSRKKTACRSPAFTKIICAGGISRGPASSSWHSRPLKRKWITSSPAAGVGSTGATTCGASSSMRITCTPSAWISCTPSNRIKRTGIHRNRRLGAPEGAPLFSFRR